MSDHDQPLDLELVTPPTVRPLDLGEAKAHLRVEDESTEENEVIQAYVDVAVARLDGSDGILGRALVEQTWVLYLDAFPSAGCGHRGGHSRLRPSDEIVLPLRPLIAVDEIAYVDPSGATQVLDPSAYQVLAGERAGVRPAFGQVFPLARRQARAVSITFRVGYAQAGSGEPRPADVPAPIRQALKLMIGDLYDNREAVVIDASRVTVVENPTIDRLLAPYRVWL